MGDKKIYAKL